MKNIYKMNFIILFHLKFYICHKDMPNRILSCLINLCDKHTCMGMLLNSLHLNPEDIIKFHSFCNLICILCYIVMIIKGLMSQETQKVVYVYIQCVHTQMYTSKHTCTYIHVHTSVTSVFTFRILISLLSRF